MEKGVCVGGSSTPTKGPSPVPRCPFAGDNYRTQLVPVGPASPQLPFPSHYQRFVISTFTFVEPPSMAVLEGEVRGGPGVPCSITPGGLTMDFRYPWSSPWLASPHPNTPKTHPSTFPEQTPPRAGCGAEVLAQGCCPGAALLPGHGPTTATGSPCCLGWGVPWGLEHLLQGPQHRWLLTVAHPWFSGVHLVQRFCLPPGTARALPALLPAGSAFT